jgi:hypothetical protein
MVRMSGNFDHQKHFMSKYLDDSCYELKSNKYEVEGFRDAVS